ncbi:P-loop ATPase, Sll1717 family [Roseivirga thermotolerans]|uniref:P-loop ATPase, Sll1717 family n=1 Tax=Roseivirga thermotolerans TaxID=1758176 RepID=UPI00273F0940|nr:hypothetical protein [Roseivirga thermotolerans]
MVQPNQYKFRRNVDIGSLAAEDDKFLLTAFVDKHDLTILRDMKDPKCILIGRTGCGKSALIRYIEENESHVARISPESMSLRHLSNSDIINYFRKINVKLDLFYKVLWKHVFIVELIKLHFDGDLTKSKGILDWIKSNTSDKYKNKKQSIEYLEQWEDRFWENTEYRIKELETSLEKRFKGEFGGNLDLNQIIKLAAKGESEQKNSKTVKYEVINKAQKVVNESQIEHIRNIIDMMKNELFSRTQKKYFIIIDDLDKEWVSNTIVYDLIKSLIETIKDFSKVANIKIVIALRTNIHKKIFKENISRGIQREKYNHLYLDIQWNKEELLELLDNRLRELMKNNYTSDSPKVDDILPSANKKQSSGFEYIVERTFMRPRDVIDFFNKCIKNADGKTKISREVIRKAEDEYSHERLRALNDEWIENYGNIHCIYKFLKGCPNGFKIEDIISVVEDSFLDSIGNNEVLRLSIGLQASFREFGEKYDTKKLLKEVLIILYEIGLLGIKQNTENRKEYIYESYSAYEVDDIIESTRFYVHPMFHKALRIK